MKILALIFTILTSLSQIYGQSYYFDYNKRCHEAYKLMISLRIEEGKKLLEEERRQNPNNLIPITISSYEDCLILLFNGDPQEYKKRKPNLDKNLSLLDKGDKNSAWYRYSKALVNFHWAAIRIRFSEYMNGGMGFRKSYLLLNENKKLHPSFKYNQVLLGLEEAIVGTVPDSYKWITNMLGMKGDVRKGTAKIVQFLNSKEENTSLMREEAMFYYCYLKFYLLSDPEGVWKYIRNSKMDCVNNHLFAFMKTNMALNDNKAYLAEQTINARNKSNSYFETPIFNYQAGIALMRKLDASCVGYFQKFLSSYTGNLFVKDAYQKLSLYYLTKENVDEADRYRKRILSSGNAQIDADKQAQRYALNPKTPHHILLKSRLLCDGGYYDKAMDQISGMKDADFKDISDKLELNYRFARIYTLTGNTGKAIPYYELTIQMGKNRQEHFAARSALELGHIYEEQGKAHQAILSYKQCINMKNHDYKSSLDQKAKAGINRLQ